MLKKITIELNEEWVLSHQSDDVLPIASLKEFLQRLDLKILEESFVHISILVKTPMLENIERHIKEHFISYYSINNFDEIATITIEDYSSSSEETDIQTPDQKPQSNIHRVSNRSNCDGGYFDISNNIKRIPIKPRAKLKNDVMSRIGRLVGAHEFKALCQEIEMIAPQIIKRNDKKTFFSQNYLFSINSGYGLTTALRLLYDLLAEKKWVEPVERYGVYEFTYDNVLSKLDSVPVGRSDHVIVSIDISAALNFLNKIEFKNFLSNLTKYSKNVIFVFVIPFVDKEVLKQVKFALNDVFFIKDVSFAPLTKKEMLDFAKSEIEKRDFSISQKGLSCIYSRILEEKRDSKFYGLNTITKIVNELIYNKHLANASSKHPNSIISKKDAMTISSLGFYDDISGFDLLSNLVASENIRKKIDEIIAQILFIKQNNNGNLPCIHMQFVGNPGTGKTTVARIIGKILKEKGVLRIGEFHECVGRDLCGTYVGQTAPKTASICRDAYGSILFIDEAYSLYRSEHSDDYGREALDTLITEMENHRTDLVVILAGYKEDMALLMKGNSGLKNRIPYTIEFPNFTKDQLSQIFASHVKDSFKYDNDLLIAAQTYFNNLDDDYINSKEFSNARFVRNLFERTCAKASMRCQLAGHKTVSLTRADFDSAIMDPEFKKTEEKRRRIGFN